MSIFDKIGFFLIGFGLGILFVIQFALPSILESEFDKLMTNVIVSHSSVRFTDNYWLIPMKGDRIEVVNVRKEIDDGMSEQTKRKGASKEDRRTDGRR